MIGLFFPHSARTLREPSRRAAHETSAATAPSDGSAMTSSSRPQFFLHFSGQRRHEHSRLRAGALRPQRDALPHEVTGAHSTRRDVDPDLRALLEAHNVLDVRLYEGAQAQFERRMASLPRDNR